MNGNDAIPIATFEDKYGDERVIHKTRHGLKVRRNHVTPALQMNRPAAEMIGARIKQLREARGMTLKELGLLCGMTDGAKDRMWAIENAMRGEGMRLGTLYALAMALNVEVAALMPSVAEVAAAADVREIERPAIAVGSNRAS